MQKKLTQNKLKNSYLSDEPSLNHKILNGKIIYNKSHFVNKKYKLDESEENIELKSKNSRNEK